MLRPSASIFHTFWNRNGEQEHTRLQCESSVDVTLALFSALIAFLIAAHEPGEKKVHGQTFHRLIDGSKQ
jgi:hypothetical protein